MDSLEQMQAYHETYRQFLNAMNQLQNEQDPKIQAILEKLCKQLRVAKMSVTFYETPMKEAMQDGNFLLLYGEKTYENKMGMILRRNMTGGGNVTIYEAHPYEGAQPWTEWERKEIATILDVIFIYHGRIRTARIAERLTFWDADFNMHNLKYYFKVIGEKIGQGQIANYVACCYNLKRFSLINELIGRDNGTNVMILFAKQLEGRFKDGIVCHMGGDNFVALFEKEDLEMVRSYMQGTSIIYDEITGEQVVVTATAGYYVIPEENAIRTPSDIMEGAFLSCNIAKRSQHDSEIFWSEQVKEKQFGDKKIENMFPSALEKEEFKVYYQLKFSLEGEYHLVGAEALCRWFHDGKMIYPNDFIPVLERSINICKLDFYVLDRVCKDIRRWLDEGKTVVKVSVNLSRKHLIDQDLLQHIVQIIDRHQVPHEYIEIELTETTTDVDFKDLKRVANGLHDMGISTSVDDFGMGYSSLNLIRDVPWDVLKIDKSFLPEEEDSSNVSVQKNIMLKHVIAMAQEMGLECIVEGVETEDHVKLLKKNNCYLAQGFYFDKPLPLQEFEERLNRIQQ